MNAPKGTILIVEDNAMNLELATDLLTQAGFPVQQAMTVARLLELARGGS